MRARRMISVGCGVVVLTALGTLSAKPVAFGRGRVAIRRAPTPPPSSSAPIDPLCDNRTGNLDGCAKPIAKECADRTSWSSSCESLVAIGFQPRIADSIAKCVAKEHIARPSCEPVTLPKCIREAVATACPEPDAAARCDALFQSCRLAAMKPTFTHDECVQMVSAMVPGGDRDGIVNQLSPTMDACNRETAMPFQPWAKKR